MRLDICCADLGAEQVDWVLSGEGENTSGGRDSLAALAERVGALDRRPQVTLWLPGEDVLEIGLRFPGRAWGRARRAAPYLLEESLASEIEQVHWQFAQTGSQDGRRRLLAVDRAGFAELVRRLRELQLEPQAAYPDYSGLAHLSSADILVVFAGDRCLLCHSLPDDRPSAGSPQGFAIPSSALPEALEKLTENLQAPFSLEPLVSCGDGEKASDLESRVNLLVMQGLSLIPAELPEILPPRRIDPLPSCLRAPDNRRLNLCAGSYAATRSQTPSVSDWWPVTGLAALWLAVTLLAFGLQAQSSESSREEVHEEARQLYRDYFREDPLPGIDLRRQAQAKLGVSGSLDAPDGDFLTVLWGLSQAFSEGDKLAVRLISAHYLRSRDESALEMEAASFAELEALRKRFVDLGFTAEIAFANQAGERVRARLQISKQEEAL